MRQFLYKLFPWLFKVTPAPTIIDAPKKESYLFAEDQIVIEEYDDVEVIGSWGCMNMDTGESEIRGDLLSRTIKFRNPDGSIHLDSKWYPDSEEKNDVDTR